jgi:hypothetical protein
MSALGTFLKSPVNGFMEATSTGLLKGLGGLVQGFGEGVAMQRSGLNLGLASYPGRAAGAAIGGGLGLIARSLGLGAMGVGYGAVKAAPGLGIWGLKATANTVRAAGGRAAAASYMTGRAVSAVTKAVPRNAGNLWLGREIKPAIGWGIEGVGLLAAGASAWHQVSQQENLGAISGYSSAPPALAYDGDVPPERSGGMAGMGGTGDLVTSLHSLRHGR